MFHMMSCQAMFNMGWAIVQIAHLSMIPSLTKSEGDDVKLNSIRQGNVYFASILVYLLAGVLIKNSNDGFQYSDRWSIMYLTYISIAIGMIASIAFHCLTPEIPSSTPVLESTCFIDTSSRKRITWREWFKKPGFYRVCICYTLTRLVYNMTLLFFPLLLSTAMRYPMNYIGYCPLVLYCAGLFYSLGISLLIKWTNKKVFIHHIVFLIYCCTCSINGLQQGMRYVYTLYLKTVICLVGKFLLTYCRILVCTV